MIKKPVCLLLLALSLTMTTCTSATNTTLQPSENYPPTTPSEAIQTIYFPRQEKTDGERAVMDGEMYGTLVLANNCIRLERDDSDNSLLLIWPPGFNLLIENGTIKILNGLKKFELIWMFY